MTVVDDEALTVGGDDLGAQQVVDRQAMASHQPADAPTQGHPGDAGLGDDPAGGGQPERLGGGVQLTPSQPALRPDRASGRIHRHRLEASQVDDQSVITHGVAGDAVPAPAHGDRQLTVAGEPQRGHHVVHAAAAGDEPGVTVDGAVPYAAGVVVAGVGGGQDRPREPGDRRGPGCGPGPRGARASRWWRADAIAGVPGR